MQMTSWHPVLRCGSGAVVLFGVPLSALMWFAPGAWQSLGTIGPTVQSRFAASLTAGTPHSNNVLGEWSDTASTPADLTPDSSAEAAKVVNTLTQQLAALQTQAGQQSDPIKLGTLSIEATTLKTNLQTFSTIVTNSMTQQGLSPYDLAHARSGGLHQEINQLRLAVKQLTNQASATVVAQILNLRYEEATALDHGYRSLTGQRASAASILSNLTSLDQLMFSADTGARSAQTQEVTTGIIVPVNASAFTFSHTTQP
jgi:hypothetical protein